MERLDDVVPVMRTFIHARDALTDAEERGVQHSGVLALADVLVAARMEVAKGRGASGWEGGESVRGQLRRGAGLFNEKAGAGEYRSSAFPQWAAARGGGGVNRLGGERVGTAVTA